MNKKLFIVYKNVYDREFDRTIDLEYDEELSLDLENFEPDQIIPVVATTKKEQAEMFAKKMGSKNESKKKKVGGVKGYWKEYHVTLKGYIHEVEPETVMLEQEGEDLVVYFNGELVKYIEESKQAENQVERQ